mmetsp:Transcript_13375/g.45221  ORF Transcript_13375/g.45221 Transcript_13375/m.45221 type:complete len:191 (-) Transcript_13375:109-681(-)
MDALGLNLHGLDHRKLLNLSILVMAVWTLAFFISSLVVADTANEGFNVVLTGLLYAGFVIASYQIINKRATPLSVGFLVGLSFVLVFISLQTAVFWGQLAQCDETDENITGYSCDDKAAMRSVSAFASLQFLTLGAFTAMLILHRDDVLGDFHDISGPSSIPGGPDPYDAGAPPPGADGAAYNPGASADL